MIAVAVGIGIFTVQNAAMWTPLQRWYWGQYLNTEVFPTRASSPHGNYRLLAKVDRHGQQRMAVDSDVVPTRTLGRQLIPFALSPQTRQAGAVELVVDTVHYSSQQMHEMLAEWIYDHQSPDDLIRPAWMGALGVFVLGLVLAIPRDRARLHMLEHGRRLKGPQMVTVKEFNRWSKLHGHPVAEKVYAWAHDTNDPQKPRRHVTVLHIPPVNSALHAVRAAIIQEFRSGQSTEEA